MTGQQVIKALQKSGWVIDRRTHHTILKKKTENCARTHTW